MELTPKTKIDELLRLYPFLLDYLASKSPKYELLGNPLARKTIGKVATLSQVAGIGGFDQEEFIAGIAAEIDSKSGEVTIPGGEAPSLGGEVPPAARVQSQKPDRPAMLEDRAARQQVLKGIIRDLHDGVSIEVLKKRFHDLIKDVDASEIAAMEQGLIAEGMPESEIKRLCDVHVQVFQESLGRDQLIEAPAGHPVHTFMLENRAAEAILRELTGVLDKECGTSGPEWLNENRDESRKLLERLSKIDLHFLRKENQLFPLLEQHDITGPSQVMWALHDDIRGALKGAATEIEEEHADSVLNTIRYAVKSIADMIYKEENILFPMAMETLSEADWVRVGQGEQEIGYAWIEPPDSKWLDKTAQALERVAGTAPATGTAPAAIAPAAQVNGPAPAAEPPSAGMTGAVSASVLLHLETGSLTPEQVNLMLTTMPIELSFVDENDEVRYFTRKEHKIFPRSPGVIGRRVQNCHPPASLDRVQRILDEFRAGTRDSADFWIEKKGRFLYIAYYAVRDAAGIYRGTLEAVQDVTGIRGLRGEKRLLD